MLTPTNRPTIDCQFYGSATPATALYDTGAQVSIISEATFRKIPVDLRPPQRPGPKATLTSVAGDPLPVRGMYRLRFNLRGRSLEHDFYVVSNLRTEALFGVDLIKRHNLSYHAKSNTVNLGDIAAISTWDKASLISASAITIPPLGTSTVHARIMSTPTIAISGPGTAYIKPTSTKIPVAADEGIVTFSTTGHCRFLINNLSHSDLHLPANTWLGNAEPIDPGEVASISLEDHDKPASTEPQAKGPSKEKLDYLLGTACFQNISPEMKDLLIKNHDIFSHGKHDLGLTKTMEHSIHLKDDAPVYRKQYPIPATHRQVLVEHLTNWLKLKVVSPSQSKYNSPIFCVLKKDKTLRPVLDYRALNDKTHIDKYSGMDVQSCIDEVGRSKSDTFSSLDLTAGFWQLPLNAASRPYTCFTLPGIGSFQWNTTPMGLLGSPASFGRLMDFVMRQLACAIAYMDDVLVHSRGMVNHLRDLQQCFNRLRANNLKLNPAKCAFGKSEVNYLGFTITPKGVLPGKEKTSAIADFLPPSTIRQVREFTGLCNYFRQSVPNFSFISQHLTALLKKESTWKGGILPPQALAAFEKLKKLLTNPPVLAFPDPEKSYFLMTDASLGSSDIPGGLGACLVQYHNDIPKPVAFASRSLVKHEKNYTVFLLELTACVWGIQHFDTYLKDNHFFLYTDHRPLEKLSTVHTKTLNRLQQLMLTYNFTIVYHPGKLNVVPDFLSRNPIASIDLSYDALLQAQKEDLQIQSVLSKPLSSSFTLQQGVLFRVSKSGKKSIFAPEKFRAAIIQAAHNSLLGGHMGIFKTYTRIINSYFWPLMNDDIKKHIQSCPTCQITRPYNHPNKTPLKAIEQPLNVNHRIHVDLFGPLATSENKNNYILAITDSFSKYCELVALKDKTSNSVAAAIFDHWITRYSTPHTIISDNGMEFVGQVTKKLFKKLQILHNTTTPYHPQANAQVETFNLSIKRYLQAFLEAPFLDWEQFLPCIRFCYNTSVSKATKATPFSLVFGIDPHIPFFDLERYISYDESATNADQLTRLFRARELAKENNLEYKAIYTEQYNRANAARPNLFVKGEQVFLSTLPLQKFSNAKLQKKYSGPFSVVHPGSKTSTITAPGKRTWRVSNDRLKKSHTVQNEEIDDNWLSPATSPFQVSPTSSRSSSPPPPPSPPSTPPAPPTDPPTPRTPPPTSPRPPSATAPPPSAAPRPPSATAPPPSATAPSTSASAPRPQSVRPKTTGQLRHGSSTTSVGSSGSSTSSKRAGATFSSTLTAAKKALTPSKSKTSLADELLRPRSTRSTFTAPPIPIAGLPKRPPEYKPTRGSRSSSRGSTSRGNSRPTSRDPSTSVDSSQDTPQEQV